MKRFLLTVILLVFGFGLNANAQTFTIGANIGLPSLLELRAAYETPEFGVRIYYGLPIILPSAGVDAYAIIPDALRSWRFGAGIATMNYVTGNYSGGTWLALRGLFAFNFNLGSNLGFVLEWRPGIPIAIDTRSGGLGFTEWTLILLASFNIGLELRI